ncbi:MAG: hypothetical protein JSS66_07015 [Armatimonadetes bacterium]|nr:hypothetical protein [Armatimonadota bacterium]
MERLAAARDFVYDMGSTLNGTEFDDILALATAMRAAEKTLTTSLEEVLAEAITGLEAYFVDVTGGSMRAYYTGLDADTTVAWDNDFRNLWRTLQAEELIIALSSATKSAGSWTVSLDADGIQLPNALELRPETTIGASDVIVTLVLDVDDETTATIGVRIPASTAADTVFPVRNSAYDSFVGVSSMTVTGGTNGDSIKLWLSV